MFIADNSIVAFKKDIARLNQIDSTAQALSMATYNQLSSNSGDKDYSLFGRKLEKQVKNLEMIEKDVIAELKRIDIRIRHYEDKHNGSKAEIDLRNYKGTLIKTRIDIVKTIIDTEAKIEKGRIDIIKVSSDVMNQNTPMSRRISTPDNFMSSIFSKSGPQNVDPISIPEPSMSYLEQPAESTIESINVKNPTPVPITINQKEHL